MQRVSIALHSMLHSVVGSVPTPARRAAAAALPGFALALLTLVSGTPALAEQRDALTPTPPPQPRIHGPEVYGVRPGHPFIYRVPATGDRPLSFFARALPRGLTLDRDTGVIRGRIAVAGSYPVQLGAHNSAGQTQRRLKIIAGDALALSPPMGWSTWYTAFDHISDSMVRAEAEALLASGLADHGYAYVEIDDGWNIRAPTASTDENPRDARGRLKTGASFPDMKALTEALHALGLKAGIYTSPGPQTCGKYAGSYGHERIDALTFAAWGFDLLKYDLCSYEAKFLIGHGDPKVREPFARMGQILRGLDRDVVYSLCQYGYADSWKWARAVHGNTWRTTDDLGDDRGEGLWANVVDFGFGQAGKEAWAGPGGWNDPDNLQLGRIVWHDHPVPTPLSHNEQYSHFTLWAMLAAPLIMGGDLLQLDDFTLRLLGNDEVIAVDQDPLGKQATPQYRSGNIEVWTKVLQSGMLAVAFFNHGDTETKASVHWSDLHLTGPRAVRDLWRQKNLGIFVDEFQISVGEHGAELILVDISSRPVDRRPSRG